MPNINIKKEKVDAMEAKKQMSAPNPGRKIVLKKKLLLAKGKRKGTKHCFRQSLSHDTLVYNVLCNLFSDKSSLEKVKVKTFDEIMREKKIKKEKTSEGEEWQNSHFV
jgi:hypothetical protein